MKHCDAHGYDDVDACGSQGFHFWFCLLHSLFQSVLLIQWELGKGCRVCLVVAVYLP